VNSRVRTADICDGTSSTVAIGEAVFLFEHIGLDYDGIKQYCDHWYVGSPSLGENEASELMGSTGVAINTDLDSNVVADEKELSFSSRHPGGAHVVYADGHVSFISETIDRRTWSALGTRAAREVVGSH
jgi:prepilin-type processing-associated H-X9-DG protein